MLPYDLWADLAEAFVRAQVSALGWRVRKVHRAPTGSRYLYLVPPPGYDHATVRLSDHRPHRTHAARHSMLSIRHTRTGRLRSLRAFLRSRLSSTSVRGP